MTKVRWYSKEKLFPAAKSKIKPAEVVLDIGCGIQPQQLIKPDVHICCEPFKQYVEALKIKTKDVNDRIFVFINATWEEATRLFPERSVDSIFLLDVIEHLEKKKH
jgi:cyclopropane fatty-acyl-phospholipid synthase-like methyltransferase